jgi:predicted nucleotidyltransferase
MIVPNMGSERRANLAGALFTPVQQRVLALLFGQPERRFQSAEVIRLAKSGTGAVHRQLARLENAGLSSPVFDELHGIVVKTVAVVEPLRRALERKAKRIVAAFVYGSVSKGSDRAGSDIDLMVISDSLTYPDLFEALKAAEADLARPVNPTVMTSSEWRAKQGRKDSFVARVAAQPKLFVVGSEDDLR